MDRPMYLDGVPTSLPSTVHGLAHGSAHKRHGQLPMARPMGQPVDQPMALFKDRPTDPPMGRRPEDPRTPMDPHGPSWTLMGIIESRGTPIGAHDGPPRSMAVRIMVHGNNGTNPWTFMDPHGSFPQSMDPHGPVDAAMDPDGPFQQPVGRPMDTHGPSRTLSTACGPVHGPFYAAIYPHGPYQQSVGRPMDPFISLWTLVDPFMRPQTLMDPFNSLLAGPWTLS